LAKVYVVNGTTRFSNRILATFINLGVMPQKMHVLTVPGRKTGKLHSTPVSIVTSESGRYLVSPYGEVSWVKNARVSGEVMLRRGSTRETLKIKELPPAEAASILKTYVSQEPITRPYFNLTPEPSMADFTAEASAHPVFELLEE
jgi:deazaflavin-dependent oxidoreductase (nitroreductase family)